MFDHRQTKDTIENINKFFDILDQVLLVFKDGVKNYLYNHTKLFHDNLKTMTTLEADANSLRRQIENYLYSQSALNQVRGDIMKLIERVDHIVQGLNDTLMQFEIEQPYIPSELNADFMKLTELSTLSVESVVPAAKAYFRSPETITEKIHRVYFYEKESNKQSQSIKRRVFHDITTLKLSEKFHLRYFALHIETLSNSAEKTADLLSIMAIKRKL
jgi:Phosphate transport regulator (distant homolog of PhoU)